MCPKLYVYIINEYSHEFVGTLARGEKIRKMYRYLLVQVRYLVQVQVYHLNS